jgi:fructokinase
MSFNVIGIGEVLWDLLPSGPQLGGAPANFAYHAQALGARAQVITRVGKDRFGREICERFQEMGLSQDEVQVDEVAPTGTVTVTITGNGVPNFIIHENVAWDRLVVTQTALEAVRAANAICFGSLAQREPVSRQAIQRLVAAAPADALRVFDINLRQSFYSREVIERSLQLANVLKLNDAELPVLAQMFELGDSPRQQVKLLAEGFSLRGVVLTRGAEGSLLYAGGRWSEQTAQPVQVVDTVGAGDAFTAALVVGLLHQQDLDEVHAFAADVARYVCSCAGATPSLPSPLRNRFVDSQPSELQVGDAAVPVQR